MQKKGGIDLVVVESSLVVTDVEVVAGPSVQTKEFGYRWCTMMRNRLQALVRWGWRGCKVEDGVSQVKKK